MSDLDDLENCVKAISSIQTTYGTEKQGGNLPNAMTVLVKYAPKMKELLKLSSPQAGNITDDMIKNAIDYVNIIDGVVDIEQKNECKLSTDLQEFLKYAHTIKTHFNEISSSKINEKDMASVSQVHIGMISGMQGNSSINNNQATGEQRALISPKDEKPTEKFPDNKSRLVTENGNGTTCEVSTQDWAKQFEEMNTQIQEKDKEIQRQKEEIESLKKNKGNRPKTAPVVKDKEKSKGSHGEYQRKLAEKDKLIRRLKEENESLIHRDKSPKTEPAVKDKQKSKGSHEEYQRKLAEKDKQIQHLKEEKESLIQSKEKSKESLEECQRKLAEKDKLIQHLKEEKESLIQSLSDKWNEHVAADERNLENISIKNRPMTVAVEYEELRTQAWLDAKTELDSVCEKSTEKDKHLFLCDILMRAEEAVKCHFYSLAFDIYTKISQAANVPAAGQVDAKQNSLATSKTHITPGKSKEQMLKSHNFEKHYQQCIPQNLKNAIGDFLRRSADTANINGIFQEIQHKLMSETTSLPLEFIPKINNLETNHFQSYINTCGRLAWKMIIQRPPMTFDIESGIGEPWKGEKIHSVDYGSKNPQDKMNVVQYYVHPALFHDKSLMVRGTVYISDVK